MEIKRDMEGRKYTEIYGSSTIAIAMPTPLFNSVKPSGKIITSSTMFQVLMYKYFNTRNYNQFKF